MKLSTLNKNGLIVFFRPGTADEAVLKESFEYDIFLKGTPEYRLQENHIIIDIGAHIGCFSLLVSSKVQKGKVYAFEPAVETYRVLQRNIEGNRLKNINSYRLAVAQRTGTATLYHDMQTGNWGNSITKALSDIEETVQTITLKSFVENENLKKVHFVKFNCEGAEFEILLNTPKDILQRIETMLILYHEELVTGVDYKTLVKYLSDAGFRIHHRKRNKTSKSGWIIAYQASVVKNILIKINTLPLTLILFVLEMKRKINRGLAIIFQR